MARSSLVWLLDDLCVQLGLCLSPVDQQRMLQNPPRDADSFPAQVLAANGLEPLAPSSRGLYQRLRAMVSASLFEER